jgi:polyphosphate kinase
MTMQGCHQFRVTRNSDLFVDDDETEDLLRAVQGELASRRYGDAVRLETMVDCPAHLRDFLLARFELGPDDHYPVAGPVNLNRLTSIYDLVDRRDLKFPPFVPAIPRRLVAQPDMFEAIRDKDVLLHHPFHSFGPVIDFLRQSASDPNVLAIKQTLYRTGPDSPVVDALVDAARAGKEVTVIIELMARFDEAANIALANRLQEAGAHVMYGVVGYRRTPS